MSSNLTWRLKPYFFLFFLLLWGRLRVRDFFPRSYSGRKLWIPSGKGYGSLPELTEVSGTGMEVWQILTEVPGFCIKVALLVRKTRGSSGRVYERCTRIRTRTRTRTSVFYEVSGTGYIPRYLPYTPGIYPAKKPGTGSWDVGPVPRVL